MIQVKTESPMGHPPYKCLYLNRDGKNGTEQCLAGSLSGADSSQRVTEEFIKVSLVRMEIGLKVQKHKLA